MIEFVTSISVRFNVVTWTPGLSRVQHLLHLRRLVPCIESA